MKVRTTLLRSTRTIPFSGASEIRTRFRGDCSLRICLSERIFKLLFDPGQGARQNGSSSIRMCAVLQVTGCGRVRLGHCGPGIAPVTISLAQSARPQGVLRLFVARTIICRCDTGSWPTRSRPFQPRLPKSQIRSQEPLVSPSLHASYPICTTSPRVSPPAPFLGYVSGVGGALLSLGPRGANAMSPGLGMAMVSSRRTPRGRRRGDGDAFWRGSSFEALCSHIVSWGVIRSATAWSLA